MRKQFLLLRRPTPKPTMYPSARLYLLLSDPAPASSSGVESQLHSPLDWMSFTEIGMRLADSDIRGGCLWRPVGRWFYCLWYSVCLFAVLVTVSCVCLIINNGQEWRTQDGPYYFETMEIKITFRCEEGKGAGRSPWEGEIDNCCVQLKMRLLSYLPRWKVINIGDKYSWSPTNSWIITSRGNDSSNDRVRCFFVCLLSLILEPNKNLGRVAQSGTH